MSKGTETVVVKTKDETKVEEVKKEEVTKVENEKKQDLVLDKVEENMTAVGMKETTVTISKEPFIQATGPLGGGIKPAYFGDQSAPRERKSFESGLQMHLTKRLLRPYFDERTKYTIGNFDDRPTFELQLAELVHRIAEESKAMIVNIDTVVMEPFRDAKIIPFESMGANPYKMMLAIPRKRYSSVVQDLRILEATDVDSTKTKIKFGVVMLPEEHQFYQMGMDQSQLYIGEVKDMWNFLRALDDDFRKVAELPIFNEKREKIMLPKPMQPYMDLFSNVENRLLWPMLVEYHLNLAKEFIPVSIISGTQHEGEVQAALETRLMQFTESSKITQLLIPEKARTLIYQLWVSMNMGSICKMSLRVDVRGRFYLATILDCLLMKLMIPRHALDYRSAMDIDNYLARFFIPAFGRGRRDARAVDPIWDEDRAYNHVENYLTTACRAGRLNGFPKALAFLQTTDAGDGWCDAGFTGVRGFTGEMNRFVNTMRGARFIPYGQGNLQFPDDTRSLQWQRFREFVTELAASDAKMKFESGPRDTDALRRMLNLVAGRGEAYAQFSYYFNRVQEKMSVLSTLLPAGFFEHEHDTFKEKLQVETFAAWNLLFLSDSVRMEMLDVPIRVINNGWAMHAFIHDFLLEFYYWRRRLNRINYPKRKVMRLAMEKCTAPDPGLKSALMASLGEAAIVDTLQLPSETTLNQEEVQYRDRILYIVLSRPEAFGFATQWVFSTRHVSLNNEVTNINWMAPARTDDEWVVTSEMFERMVQQREVGRLANYARAGNVVRFRIPVKLDHEVVDKIPEQHPIVSVTGDKPLKLDTLKFYFTYEDEEYLQDENRNFAARIPEFLPVRSYLRFVDEAHIRDYFHILEMWNEGYKIWKVTDFKFFVGLQGL